MSIVEMSPEEFRQFKHYFDESLEHLLTKKKLNAEKIELPERLNKMETNLSLKNKKGDDNVTVEKITTFKTIKNIEGLGTLKIELELNEDSSKIPSEDDEIQLFGSAQRLLKEILLQMG